MPFVSIVVCVYNDEAYLIPCLESLKRQTYPDFEIIVVDDGSTDGCGNIAKGMEGIVYIYQDNQGPSVARNHGVTKAKGKFVAFTDSDCEVKEDWLEQLIRCFDDSVAAVGGRQVGHPQDNEFAKKVDRFLRAIGFIGDYVKPHNKLKEVSHNASCNSGYRKSAILEVGGFREGLFPGEDVDLDKRLRDKGYKILFTPEAVVYHHRPDNRQRWHRMLINYGRASADNLRLHGPFRVIQVVPMLLLIVILIVGFLLVFETKVALIVTIASVLIGLLWLKLKSQLSFREVIIFSLETMILFSLGFWKSIFGR